MRVASAGVKNFPDAASLFQRAPADELHPEPDVIVDVLRAVNGHDVVVADACEQATFANDE